MIFKQKKKFFFLGKIFFSDLDFFSFFCFFSAKSKCDVENMYLSGKIGKKTRILAIKISQKIEKKIFLSEVARNRLKLSKNAKNRFSDRYSSF